MNVTPDTTIRLLKCPLELDNKNQITFTTLQAQTTYFLSLTYLEVDGSMYQRKDSSIYYPGLFDDLIGYNYVMYQNTHYSNKWFYAFITGMEYLNDHTTRIQITTDVFQTWQFDVTYKASFVEREMIAANSDVPGANLVPENLETGEFKVNSMTSVSGLTPVYVIAYSNEIIKIQGAGTTTYSCNIGTATGEFAFSTNGIPTSVYYICATTLDAYKTLMESLKLDNQSEYVVAAFTIPSLATTGIRRTLSVYVSNIYALARKCNCNNSNIIFYSNIYRWLYSKECET